jgi:hypothetical protein
MSSGAAPGWHIFSQIDGMHAQPDGAPAGMGECTLPMAHAVTACHHETRVTVSLGAGHAGHDERAERTESLFARKDGVIVHAATI